MTPRPPPLAKKIQCLLKLKFIQAQVKVQGCKDQASKQIKQIDQSIKQASKQIDQIKFKFKFKQAQSSIQSDSRMPMRARLYVEFYLMVDLNDEQQPSG